MDVGLLVELKKSKEEMDAFDFSSFVNMFHQKIKNVINYRARLEQRRHILLKQANDNPNIIFNEEFIKSMRLITNVERRLHRGCEVALLKARDYLTKIEADEIADTHKTLLGRVTNEDGINISGFLKYLDEIKSLMKHIEKRMEKIDKRLTFEERYLETGDSGHFKKFLVMYQKELNQDLKLAREFNEGKIDVGRLENSVQYNLKRAGIKVAAGAAIAPTIAVSPLLKGVELCLRPLSIFFADLLGAFLSFGAYQNTEETIRNMDINKRIQFEIMTTPILGSLIEKLSEPRYATAPIKKSSFFSSLNAKV
jgi:hypothetical protein